MNIISKEHLAVIQAASLDETRPILNSVLVEEADGVVKTTATDGKILAHVEGKTEFDANDFPAIEAMAAAPNTATRAIVPAVGLKSVLKNIPRKKTLPILYNALFKMSEKTSTFATTDLQTASVLPLTNIEGNYPTYQNVIPSGEKTQFKIAFNPWKMIQAMKIVSDVIGDQEPTATFEFTDSLSPVKITANGSNGTAVTVVVMPRKI